MGKTALIEKAKVLKGYVDVLYLSNKGWIPAELKRLLKQNRLSYLMLPIDKFSLVRDRVDLIGTIIIDADESTIGDAQRQITARIMESLEVEGIGVILLANDAEIPIRSFSLAPTKSSFTTTGSVKSIDADELWARISLNLAYRKKGSGATARVAVPLNRFDATGTNTLEQQLQMAGTLVGNLAEQLRMAGRVQRDFLPAQLPNCDQLRWAAIFLPAEWVSGDIYDVVRIDEQHIGFYIADAVGHAMPAALLTIFVKQALVMRETRVNNYRIFPPAEAIKNLNIKLTSQKLSGHQFATCCYCLLNVKTLQLTFARAGHPYPILIRPGSRPQQLEVRGSLLGVFENADYLQQTIQLVPGDKLLLYSDGAEPFIGRFDDLTGFQFTEQFLKITELPAAEMMDRLKSYAQNQTVKPSEFDDITAVCLQILSP
jgi:serine phosphatase RsbU (regulator of sigma subunit)